MTRWALLLEYDGTGYVGWQRQASGVSIQQLLEQAAARLNRGGPVASTVAVAPTRASTPRARLRTSTCPTGTGRRGCGTR